MKGHVVLRYLRDENSKVAVGGMICMRLPRALATTFNMGGNVRSGGGFATVSNFRIPYLMKRLHDLFLDHLLASNRPPLSNLCRSPIRNSICFLPGCDAILLGAETLRGLYPVETVVTVRKIASEVGGRFLPHAANVSTLAWCGSYVPVLGLLWCGLFSLEVTHCTLEQFE
jgi:hypothetical protein